MPFWPIKQVGGGLSVAMVRWEDAMVLLPLVVKAGAPMMNTITFLAGSASPRLHRCLQGLKRNIKGEPGDFAFLSEHLQPLELPLRR